MFPVPVHSGSPDKRKLLRLFEQLSPADQGTLLQFAAFLASRQAASVTEPVPPAEPKPMPRPAKESVVGAIKRLSSSYFMLERQELLNETAALMSAHVVQGRPAPDVIDQLEQLFRVHYQRYLGAQDQTAALPGTVDL